MAKFLALYIGSVDKAAAAPLDAGQQAAGMQAWGAWMGRIAAHVVDGGGPLGKTKRVARDGISVTFNSLTGYVIVEAESHDEAARLFENHPHFTIFPGDSVEVLECPPIPGM